MSELPKESSVAGVKAVLAEALAAHMVGYQSCRCGWFTEDGDPSRAVAEHLADVLLALPGVAVIQLPEPDRAWAKWDAWTVDDSYVVAAATGVVYLEDDESVTALPVATAQRLSERLAAAGAAALVWGGFR